MWSHVSWPGRGQVARDPAEASGAATQNEAIVNAAIEPTNGVVRAAPSRDLSGWVQEFTAYRERLARPLRRHEVAVTERPRTGEPPPEPLLLSRKLGRGSRID